jgi:hypothetical protein
MSKTEIRQCPCGIARVECEYHRDTFVLEVHPKRHGTLRVGRRMRFTSGRSGVVSEVRSDGTVVVTLDGEVRSVSTRVRVSAGGVS